MRLRTAGVGFALALSASPLLAQVTPAATLGQLRPVDDTNGTTARGQFPDPRTPITPVMAPAVAPTSTVRPLFRTQAASGTPGTPIPGAGTNQLKTDPLLPKPVPNPMVLEYRDQNGQPIPYGQPGVPIPLASTAPGTILPPPLTSNPACATCAPGTPLAVAPAAPGFAPLGLEDPYYGGAGSYGLFPRLRGAVVGGPGGERFSVGAAYLMWFARAQVSPTLFTTSSPQFNGILGQGNTRPLFGEQVLGNTLQSGGRFNASYLFANRNWGVDGNIFFLGNSNGSYFLGSDSNALIARPFTNVNTGQPFSQLTAYPGLASGTARIDFDTNIWGAEVNFKRALGLRLNPCSHLEFLIGYKNLNLSESLQITENFQRSPNSPTSIGVPNAIAGTVLDSFRTENHFHGVNIGLQGEIRRGRWYLDGKATVALGRTFQQLSINGSQSILTNTGVVQSAGGLLALPGANIGSYSQSVFGVLPEAGLTLGMYVTPRLKLGVGYTLMYLNNVIRPAGQIDTGLDVTRIPNFPLNPTPSQLAIARPSAIPMRETDFFVQGLNFQLQWTW